MEIGLWLLAVLLAIGLAHTMQFSTETLALGRALSNTDSKTGLQDAVTPPWDTAVAMAIYAGIVVAVPLTWWLSGWQLALASLAIILLGGALLKALVFSHLRGLYHDFILHSMVSRYANYVRDGDILRANAMEALLERAGILPRGTSGPPAAPDD